MWTLKHKAFVAMQTRRLRVCFPIQIKPVFQRFLFLLSHKNIRVHFGIRENLSLCSPCRCTFLFSKTFCVLICEFSKENWRSFLFSQNRVVLFFFFVFFLFYRKILYPGNKMCVNEKKPIHTTLFFFFFS